MRLLLGVSLAAALLGLQIAGATAQQSSTGTFISLAREGYRLDKAAADALEAQLAGKPDDLAARTKLLGFYFRGAVRVLGPEATIAARRRHILWLIQNNPGSEAAALSEVTIDSRGHALADKVGYEQASAAWKEQAQRRANDVAVLGNAAKFLQLSDKAQTASLIKQAQQLEPQNPKWPGWLGYVYAISILGVDMMNQNGLPTSHNAEEAKGPFAVRALDELGRSNDLAVVGVAGRILWQYGLMMTGMFRGTNRFAVEYAALAEALLLKAQQLEPGNAQWSADLEQLRQLQSQAAKAK